MKKICGIVLCLLFAGCMLTACQSRVEIKSETVPKQEIGQRGEQQAVLNKEENGMQRITVETGGQSFQAIVYENETVTAWMDMLPLTLTMDDLHGNEKYYYLDTSLPAAAESIENIRTGDIMLYGSDCLVVFYKDFSTSYSYTRIGRMEDAAAFAEALGSGTAEITFRTQEQEAGHDAERI